MQYFPINFGYLDIAGDDATFLTTAFFGVVKFVNTLLFAVVIFDLSVGDVHFGRNQPAHLDFGLCWYVHRNNQRYDYRRIQGVAQRGASLNGGHCDHLPARRCLEHWLVHISYLIGPFHPHPVPGHVHLHGVALGVLLWLLQGDAESACSDEHMGCVPVFSCVLGLVCDCFIMSVSGEKGTPDVT